MAYGTRNAERTTLARIARSRGTLCGSLYSRPARTLWRGFGGVRNVALTTTTPWDDARPMAGRPPCVLTRSHEAERIEVE